MSRDDWPDHDSVSHTSITDGPAEVELRRISSTLSSHPGAAPARDWGGFLSGHSVQSALSELAWTSGRVPLTSGEDTTGHGDRTWM
jgi:hypothetical protein